MPQTQTFISLFLFYLHIHLLFQQLRPKGIFLAHGSIPYSEMSNQTTQIFCFLQLLASIALVLVQGHFSPGFRSQTNNAPP
jgi:hypothetical protein